MENEQPRQGARVVSSTGEYIGIVSRVARGRFEVTDGGREIWLRDDALARVSSDGLTLVCDGHHLYQHVATPPPAALAH